MIEDLDPKVDKSALGTYEAIVQIPSGGILLDSALKPLVAVFGVAFKEIHEIVAELKFDGDLWGPNETWYSPEYGGQKNLDVNERLDATLRTLSCTTFFKFIDGRFKFNMTCENGTVNLVDMKFTVSGRERDC